MFTKMIKFFSVFLCFLLGKEVISMEFDFITEYQIVRTKVSSTEHGVLVTWTGGNFYFSLTH